MDKKEEQKTSRKITFGCEGYVCYMCHKAEALEVYLDGKEVGRREHRCDPLWMLRSDPFDSDGRFKDPSVALPEVLFAFVKKWAKNGRYLQSFRPGDNGSVIDLGSVDHEHWAARAIRGRTTLNDREVMDFVKKAKGTFNVFKVQVSGNGGRKAYGGLFGMIITDKPLEFV